MTISCMRRLEWDSGHRVLGHGGKCRYLHGHRYTAEVHVQSPELDDLGMVVDFGIIKERIGEWINSNWDHALLLHPSDPLIDSLAKAGEHFKILADNPTAENLAKALFRVAKHILPPPLQVIKVTVWETPSCCASYIS